VHTKIVNLLVDAGVDIDKAVTDEATPLFIAAQHGHIDVVCSLIENGADAGKTRAVDGATALYINPIYPPRAYIIYVWGGGG